MINKYSSSRETPACVTEYATQLVHYVQKAIGIELTYDSETLSVLDHYLQQTPRNNTAIRDVIATTAGAYWGEVVRKTLGGTWTIQSQDEPFTWKFTLPGGLTFFPANIAVVSIMHEDVDGYDDAFHANPKMLSFFQDSMAESSSVSIEVYYSLTNKFDTLEQLQDLMLAYATQKTQKQSPNLNDA